MSIKIYCKFTTQQLFQFLLLLTLSSREKYTKKYERFRKYTARVLNKTLFFIFFLKTFKEISLAIRVLKIN